MPARSLAVGVGALGAGPQRAVPLQERQEGQPGATHTTNTHHTLLVTPDVLAQREALLQGRLAMEARERHLLQERGEALARAAECELAEQRAVERARTEQEAEQRAAAYVLSERATAREYAQRMSHQVEAEATAAYRAREDVADLRKRLGELEYSSGKADPGSALVDELARLKRDLATALAERDAARAEANRQQSLFQQEEKKSAFVTSEAGRYQNLLQEETDRGVTLTGELANVRGRLGASEQTLAKAEKREVRR